MCNLTIIDACRIAKIPLPVSHDDLWRTFDALHVAGIAHNLRDSGPYSEWAKERGYAA